MRIVLVVIVSTYICYKLLTYILKKMDLDHLEVDQSKDRVNEVSNDQLVCKKKITYSEDTMESLSHLIDTLEIVINLLSEAVSYLNDAVSSGIIDRMDTNIFLNISKYEAVALAQEYVQDAQNLMDEIESEVASIRLETNLSFALIVVLDDVVMENKVMKDVSVYKISKQGKKLLKQLKQIDKTRNQLVMQYNALIRKTR